MRTRLAYALLSATLIAVALFIRKMWAYLPHWFNIWIGDYLWAVMLYVGVVAAVWPADRRKTAVYLTLFSGLVELSQAWHLPWLDAFRATPLGGLLLGHGFLWTDLLAYTAGIWTAYAVDIRFLRSARQR